MTYLYIAIGGALGSIARYLMQNSIGAATGKDFPYGTLCVNILGSLLMGVFIGWLERTTPERTHEIYLFIAVGILGGFTTFSSFSLDAISLMRGDKFLAMGVYILVSVACSLAALWAGLNVVKAIP